MNTTLNFTINGTNCSEDDGSVYDLQKAISGTFIFLWVLISGMGIVIWLALSLKKNKEDAVVSKAIIMGLGVIDIIQACTNILTQILLFWFGPCKFGNYSSCVIIAYFANQALIASSIMLTVLSAERYFSLAHPFTYQNVWNVKRAVVIFAVVIVYSSLIMCLPVMGVNSFGGAVWCDFDWGDTSPSGSAFVWFIFIQGWLCIVITMVLNANVLYEVKKMKKRTDAQNNITVEVEFMIILVAKSLMFVIGTAPFLARLFVHQLFDNPTFYADFVAKRISLINNMVNTNLCWFIRLIIRSRFVKMLYSRKSSVGPM